MGLANIKIPSGILAKLKAHTGESTGQKAVQKALLYFLRDVRQRQILKVLKTISFTKGFNPSRLRSHER